MAAFMNGENNIVYAPNKFIRMGFLTSLQGMFVSLFQSRELIWRLFLRDFKAKYRQSVFGILWALINPLITVGIFVLLNRSGILNIGDTTVPYPIFALVGISVYGIFSTGLSVSASSIVGAGPMVVKINFPKISLVIASMGQALIDFFVRMLMLIILLIFYGIAPNWTLFIFPFALLPLIFLTLGVGFMLSLLAGIFRDIVHIASFLTTLFLFLMPVLYPAPQSGLFANLNLWNPLSHLIVGARDVFILGNLSNPSEYFYSVFFSLSVFLISWRIFFLSEHRIAERV